MKQYFSIFALSARSTLFKLLGIIALMGAAEIAMFYFAMEKESYGILLEELMQQSKVQLAFGVGFILYYVVLIGGFSGKHPSKSAMTTSRLGIKESSVSWVIAIYNMCTLIIFLAAQLGIVLILCKMYLSSDLAGDYQHTLFIAFYRNGMMHGLLPLEDYGAYVENIIYILSLGICGSCTSLKQRKGKSDVSAVLAAIIVALSFCGRANYFTIFGYGMIVIFFASYGAYYISKGGATDEDEDETAAPELA
ncbi:MAG: hypothetical protein IKU44_02220 [Firmicutes bacterium]|nr:hypothetical protein [Bacillota bacterium]